MPRQNRRVILASERPEARYLLRGVLEQEGGSVIVGQAENATRALTLTRKLRPDVALIDCYLPHAVGLDTVPLSRIGGLDIAQTISEEIPNIRVILLSNLDTAISPDNGIGSDVVAILSVERMGVSTPFALQDLYQEVGQPHTLVFANIEAKPEASRRRRFASLGAKDMLFGGLGILGGLSLILTLVLIEAWGVLAVVGAVAIGVGLGLLWNRAKPQKT